MPVPNARSLTIGPDGAPWLHVGYHHVYRFDGATWRLAYEAGGGRWVCDIDFDADGLPWIATDFNLYHLSDEEWTVYESRMPTALAVAPDSTIWVAHSPLSGGELNVFDGHAWITYTESLPIVPPVTALAVTGDGAVWAGTGHGGLNWLRSGSRRTS